jgi:hypothetical protein
MRISNLLLLTEIRRFIWNVVLEPGSYKTGRRKRREHKRGAKVQNMWLNIQFHDFVGLDP